MSMPVVSMMKKGLPPARAAISFACRSGIRPLLEELVAGQGHDQSAAWSAPSRGGQAFNEIQHRRLEVVCVFEKHHHRVVPSEAVDDRDEAGLNVVNEGRLLGPLGQAEQQGQALGDELSFRWIPAAGGELAPPRLDLVARV